MTETEIDALVSALTRGFQQLELDGLSN